MIKFFDKFGIPRAAESKTNVINVSFSNYTVSESDDNAVLSLRPGAGDFIVELPNPTNSNEGFKITMYAEILNGGTITVRTESATDPIAGETTYVFDVVGQTATFISHNGTHYDIINEDKNSSAEPGFTKLENTIDSQTTDTIVVEEDATFLTGAGLKINGIYSNFVIKTEISGTNTILYLSGLPLPGVIENIEYTFNIIESSGGTFDVGTLGQTTEDLLGEDFNRSSILIGQRKRQPVGFRFYVNDLGEGANTLTVNASYKHEGSRQDLLSSDLVVNDTNTDYSDGLVYARCSFATSKINEDSDLRIIIRTATGLTDTGYGNVKLILL